MLIRRRRHIDMTVLTQAYAVRPGHWNVQCTLETINPLTSSANYRSHSNTIIEFSSEFQLPLFSRSYSCCTQEHSGRPVPDSGTACRVMSSIVRLSTHYVVGWNISFLMFLFLDISIVFFLCLLYFPVDLEVFFTQDSLKNLYPTIQYNTIQYNIGYCHDNVCPSVRPSLWCCALWRSRSL